MFLTISLLTASLNVFKFIGTAFNLLISKPSTFAFKLFKLVGTLTNLLISSLSTSAFKAIKSLSAAKLAVSMPVALFNSFLVA